MATLFGSVHFWSYREDVVINDCDYGVIRYQEKSNATKERTYYAFKRDYLDARGEIVMPKNTRPIKLRDSLKELDELLAKEKILLIQWMNASLLHMIFCSGIFVSLVVDPVSCDVMGLSIDKFFQGKLLSDNVSSAYFCSRCLFFSYNDSRFTMVHFGKPFPMQNPRTQIRLQSVDPKIITVEGVGPPGRRFERKISVNKEEDMVIFWWKTDKNEVYPWTPINKDQDRSNVLIYTIKSSSVELLCYCRTEMPPLSVTFSKISPLTVLTVEQGFDKDGGVTVLSCVYKINGKSIGRISTTSIPLEAPLAAHSFNPTETALLMACNNGVLALHSEVKGMTHLTKAGLIPAGISWMSNGTLVVVCNDRAQIQCFDMSLSLIRLHLVGENLNPQRILDLNDYFSHQQHIGDVLWAPTTYFQSNINYPHIPPLLLHFIHGPLICFRFTSAQGRISDSLCAKLNPVKFGFNAAILVKQYIKNGQFDEAVNLLLALNWETEGSLTLHCLRSIVSDVLKLPLTSHREMLIETALTGFYVPAVALSESIQEEYGPFVRTLTRRFFFKVLRHGHLDKAYRLAIDLRDYDCFLSVHHVARCRGDKVLAELALGNAQEIDSGSCISSDCMSMGSQSDSCPTSCSCCSSSDSSKPWMNNEQEMEKCAGNDNNHESVEVAEQNGTLPHHHVSQSHGIVTVNIRRDNNKNVPPPVPKKPQLLKSRQGVVRNATKDSLDQEIEKLRRSYEEVVCHEVTTEEEDGGTVKVVHFGVV